MPKRDIAHRYVVLAFVLAFVLERGNKADRAAARDLRVYARDMSDAIELERLRMTYAEHSLLCDLWIYRDGPQLDRAAAEAIVFSLDGDERLASARLRRRMDEVRELGEHAEFARLYDLLHQIGRAP